MGVICATLLLLFEEEDAFWMMCSIVEDLLPGQYYSVSLFGVQVDIRVFRYLIQQYLPNIHRLFNEHDIDLTLICFQWFLTLYSNVFHTKFTFHLWDYFFYYGSIILFQIGLMMLKQYEENLLELNNSAQIFNFLCELPQLFEYEYGQNEPLFQDLPKLFSLTASSIDSYRKKYLAELMSQEGFTVNPKMPSLNLPKDILQRRHHQKSARIDRSTRSFFRSKLNSTSNNTQALIERNITQTEMLVNLREAILKIAKHFKDNDADGYTQQNIDLNVDYSIESHVKDHEHYANISLQKCKRAKALLDFECQDSNELGFKRNDILKILSMADEHCWIGELNGKHGWFPAKFVQLVDERSKLYSLAGDDSVNENISDLVRGKLASCIKSIFEHGLRRTATVLGTGTLLVMTILFDRFV
jgi:small G protein signaling modulator 3